jgi:Flp pilus assembly protein TadD
VTSRRKESARSEVQEKVGVAYNRSSQGNPSVTMTLRPSARGKGPPRKEAFADAIAEFQKALSLSPNITDYKGGLGYAYAVAGERAEAHKLLEELKVRSKQSYVP